MSKDKAYYSRQRTRTEQNRLRRHLKHLKKHPNDLQLKRRLDGKN